MDAKTISVLLVACMFACMLEGASGSLEALKKHYKVFEGCNEISDKNNFREYKALLKRYGRKLHSDYLVAIQEDCLWCCDHFKWPQYKVDEDDRTCYCLGPKSMKSQWATVVKDVTKTIGWGQSGTTIPTTDQELEVQSSSTAE